MTNVVLSVLMLAAVALLTGAGALWRRGVTRQAGLMALLALIAIINVMIWTLPDAGGQAPVERLQQTDETQD